MWVPGDGQLYLELNRDPEWQEARERSRLRAEEEGATGQP